ncbi:hypothetical protein BAUCODRAFT_213508 [Baudoinia panamericana UAMH 10762]|uniref:Uncharacterized protein n=1 Tax=Baudoinia panamericana (strain UAMH 10762) TaxID=717646 RepID=M2N552_BAUPA|nr:uncharacterized protein BAUCODRAFT_213508 [Baudoinia panamericana UAMH 10762]EMC93895.1 hypothetical protein BAUCODRAFT_213508 [Baudoinia panamericana UAMH 10762]
MSIKGCTTLCKNKSVQWHGHENVRHLYMTRFRTIQILRRASPQPSCVLPSSIQPALKYTLCVEVRVASRRSMPPSMCAAVTKPQNAHTLLQCGMLPITAHGSNGNAAHSVHVCCEHHRWTPQRRTLDVAVCDGRGQPSLQPHGIVSRSNPPYEV